MLGREPAVIIAFLAALIQAGWLLYTGDVDATATWAVPVATVLGGLLTRRKVIPVETVKDAGISPREVKERAKDPGIMPHLDG